MFYETPRTKGITGEVNITFSEPIEVPEIDLEIIGLKVTEEEIFFICVSSIFYDDKKIIRKINYRDGLLMNQCLADIFLHKQKK
jgi:hypothetical protein